MDFFASSVLGFCVSFRIQKKSIAGMVRSYDSVVSSISLKATTRLRPSAFAW